MKGFVGSRNYDVIVIGAGIVGSMIARELSRYEGRVALVERECLPGFGVSKSSLAMIHSPDFCPAGTLKGRMCADAPSRFKRLAGELDVTYREVDELWLALDHSQVSNLELVKRRGEENGGAGFEIIGRDRLMELEPNVNPRAVAALYVQGLGVVHPPEWAFALTENAVANGVSLHLETTVEEIHRGEGSGYLVKTSKGDFKTRFIVNAAGLHADEIASMVGEDDIHLNLTRGTAAVLDKSVSHLIRHMIYGTFSPSHSQVITPTAHGNIILGLGYFTTPETREDTRVSRQGLQEAIAMAKELVPCLSEKDIITTFAGVRSDNNKVPNGDFYISHSRCSPGVIHALIGSPGVTTSPAVADRVIHLLSEAGLRLEPKRSFEGRREGWPRFSTLSLDEKERVISSDSGYGHVVCRCETVTRGEILQAIRRGAHVLDGVKHLTRAGMGRCQGGFCGGRVIRLLSEELKVSPKEITKKARGSRELLYETKELLNTAETESERFSAP